jgi:hypothetical protein
LKQLQEIVGNILEYIGIGNNFLNRTPKAQQVKERINKWSCSKSKTFYTGRETVTRLKRLPTEWEKIFASCSSVQRLISRIYSELKELNPQRINNPVRKWANELNRDFF